MFAGRPNPSPQGWEGHRASAGCRVGLRASTLATTLDFYSVITIVYTRRGMLSSSILDTTRLLQSRDVWERRLTILVILNEVKNLAPRVSFWG